MIAAEISSQIATIRIHDDYCDVDSNQQMKNLGRIITDHYKRKQVKNQVEDKVDLVTNSKVTS